jgi:hypothetical protein
MFPSRGERKVAPTLQEPLERADLNYVRDFGNGGRIIFQIKLKNIVKLWIGSNKNFLVNFAFVHNGLLIILRCRNIKSMFKVRKPRRKILHG